MRLILCRIGLLAMVFCGAGMVVLAAEYDLASPSIELRRLQHCAQCHEPLVVTTIAPGASVRCPKCSRVQKRLPTTELETKVYQICPSCGSRLNVSGLKPSQSLRCGSCGLAQRALAEAIYVPAPGAGTGKLPEGPLMPPSTVIQAPVQQTLTAPTVPGLNAPAPVGPAPAAQPAASSSVTPSNKNSSSEKASVSADSLAPEAYAPSGDSLRPAAWVNGKPIPESAIAQVIRRSYEEIRLNRGSADRLPNGEAQFSQMRGKILEQQIERELILQAAANAGYLPAVELVAALERSAGGGLTTDKAREELILDEMRRRYSSASSRPSEESLQAFYQKNITQFSKSDQCRLRAIVIYTDRVGRPDQRPADQIATEVRRKLEYGVDFGSLAKRYSEDAFRDEEGEVRGSDAEGWLAADNLARPVQRRLASFTPGQVAGPQALPGCVAFFRLESYQKGAARPYAEVKAEVRRVYLEQTRDKAFDDWVASLRRAALVEYPRVVEEQPAAEKQATVSQAGRKDDPVQ